MACRAVLTYSLHVFLPLFSPFPLDFFSISSSSILGSQLHSLGFFGALACLSFIEASKYCSCCFVSFLISFLPISSCFLDGPMDPKAFHRRARPARASPSRSAPSEKARSLASGSRSRRRLIPLPPSTSEYSFRPTDFYRLLPPVSGILLTTTSVKQYPHVAHYHYRGWR